jgi:hypothetical protein
MPASTQNGWDQFDGLERQRRAAIEGHNQAFRLLDIASSKAQDDRSISIWQTYCSSVRSLEEAVAHLERLVWQMQR